jgi:hypothetical protein
MPIASTPGSATFETTSTASWGIASSGELLVEPLEELGLDDSGGADPWGGGLEELVDGLAAAELVGPGSAVAGSGPFVSSRLDVAGASTREALGLTGSKLGGDARAPPGLVDSACVIARNLSHASAPAGFRGGRLGDRRSVARDRAGDAARDVLSRARRARPTER